MHKYKIFRSHDDADRPNATAFETWQTLLRNELCCYTSAAV